MPRNSTEEAGVIEHMLVLGTCHLTEHTCTEWLPAAPFAAFAKGDYGWFVYVPDDEPDDLPADLAECFALARGQHCEWIMFDRDQAAMGILPVYDWS